MTESAVSPVPHGARAYQGQRAGVATRLLAAAVDAVVVGLIIGLGYAALAGLYFLLDPRTFTFPGFGLLFSMGSALFVLVLYQGIAWHLTGRTYGNAVMGVRVINRSGGRLTLVNSFARSIATAVFPIGLLWVAVSRENHSVQDIVLRTSVIYDWAHPSEQTH